jgi:hypothetical protein
MIDGLMDYEYYLAPVPKLVPKFKHWSSIQWLEVHGC